METLFLSARQAFEGGRVNTPHGDVRVPPKSKDGQTVIAPDGDRLQLRVEPARRHTEEMAGLQAEYGGQIRVEGNLIRYPSGSRNGEETFHDTPSGPLILTVSILDGEELKAASGSALGSGGSAGAGTMKRAPRTIAATAVNWRIWSGVIALALVGGVVGFPLVIASTREARKTAHMDKVRAATTALLLYAQENDDRLASEEPLRASGWVTKTDRPLEVPDEVGTSPLQAEGSETRIIVRDAQPWPDGRRAVGYADGHVAWVSKAP